MRLFRRTKRGAELEVSELKAKYVADERFLKSLLEAVYRFSAESKPIRQNQDVGDYWQHSIEREALRSSDYLRGVAATLGDPEKMEQIADTIDSLAFLIGMGVSIERLEGEE